MEKMIIVSGSCNGEEEQFLTWMNKKYPEIETSIKNTDRGGLYEWVEEYQEWQLIPDNYWDEYCRSL